MDAVERKVAEFIGAHELFADAQRVLLAVSGGADSIALLHVLVSLRAAGILDAEFVCAHINHQLRGTAADRDEAFVVQGAAALNLPIVTKTVDARAHAREHKLSIETAARQLRLACLGKIATETECACIALGHQKNDNAETLIQRLWRGTGFRGLGGIRPTRSLDDGLVLVRPLLTVERAEIVAYLDRRGLTWCEDHTNTDLVHTRNSIRHRLLPALARESDGSLTDALSDLAASARTLYDRVQREAEQAGARLTRRCDNRVEIDASGLARLPEIVAVELIRRRLMTLGCGERDLSRRHYRRILQLARQGTDAGKMTLPGRFLAYRRCRNLVLAPPPARASRSSETAQADKPPSAVILQIPGRTRFGRYHIEARILPRDQVEAAEITRDKNRFCEYVDYDCLQRPVVVRTRRPGDRFEPLGLDAEKKVGKFLTAAKVPGPIRTDALIFEDAERIIWVCPVRISERAKVTASTRRILRLAVTSPPRPA